MPDVEGPRACGKVDLAGMISLVDAAMRQGTSQSFVTDYPLVYRDSNLQNVRIVKVGAEIVSVVPFIPRTVVLDDCRFSIGIISPTATAPDHRKKGYALACLKSCVEKMTRDSIDLSVLWTQVATFPFYEKVKYQAVRCQGWVYPCGRKDAGRFRPPDGDIKVASYDPETEDHIGDIQAMHERDVYGVLRAAGEYPVLFNLPGMRTLVALRDGKPVAYLLVSRAINKPGLLEAGGDAIGVETLVHCVLSRLGENAVLPAHANLTPSILGDVFNARLPERRQPHAGGHMMVRINHVRTFMKKIANWLVARNAGVARRFSIAITDTDEVTSFEFHDDTLELGARELDTRLEMSLRDFTSVVFGPHSERPVSVPAVVEGLFPFYFPICLLDHS